MTEEVGNDEALEAVKTVMRRVKMLTLSEKLAKDALSYAKMMDMTPTDLARSVIQSAIGVIIEVAKDGHEAEAITECQSIWENCRDQALTMVAEGQFDDIHAANAARAAAGTA